MEPTKSVSADEAQASPHKPPGDVRGYIGIGFASSFATGTARGIQACPVIGDGYAFWGSQEYSEPVQTTRRVRGRFGWITVPGKTIYATVSTPAIYWRTLAAGITVHPTPEAALASPAHIAD